MHTTASECFYWLISMFSQFFQIFPFYKQNYFFNRHMKIHMQSVKIRPEITYVKSVLRPEVTLMESMILLMLK